ncbi:MAG TPA: LLM class F420-dependent oxidoreductase [Candidatus Limnocylindrales bacterium]|nr:LLM class F420-dependent oxidoreductase [Candidatus Limnocylindrales bacterium]
MKLGLTAGAFGAQIRIDLDAIKEAESLGYDSVWTAEAWGGDAIVPLAWIGAHTSRIKLGTGIMQMPARTPAMCAMQAMTLDQLSGGRMIVGLGPSGPQVIEGWHGVPYGKPLVRTREYIAILRKIFAREEPVTFEGENYQIPYRGPGASGLGKPLRSILHGRKDIPIITATISPKGVEVAAEVADGFMPIWTSAEGLSTFQASLEKGFARSGDADKKSRFMIMPMVNVVIGDDVQACRDRVRPGIALYVGGMGAREKNFYNSLVSRMGWEGPARNIQDLFLSGRKEEATAAVPDDLVDAITLVGPKERIAERVAAWKQSGVHSLILSLSRREDMRTMAELCL